MPLPVKYTKFGCVGKEEKLLLCIKEQLHDNSVHCGGDHLPEIVSIDCGLIDDGSDTGDETVEESECSVVIAESGSNNTTASALSVVLLCIVAVIGVAIAYVLIRRLRKRKQERYG